MKRALWLANDLAAGERLRVRTVGKNAADLPPEAYTVEGRKVTVHNGPLDGVGLSLLVTGGSATPPPPPAGSAPAASFTASPTSGTWPRTVAFTDTSAGSPTAWAWDFGDGATSTAQSPSHEYADPGTYSVTLTATNANGSNTVTRTGLITITSWDPNTMLGSDMVHPNDTGMTYLADTYVAALSDAGKTPAAGSSFYAYGDSWTATDTQNSAGMRAVHQLRDRLGLTLAGNFAVSGFKVGDCAARAVGTDGQWNAGLTDLALIAAGLNDLLGSDTPQNRTAIEHYLRSMFTVICAAERIEQTAFTYTGTWGTASIATSSGGSNAYTSTDGSSASYGITTPGDYYLLLLGCDGSTHIGGQFTVSQNGANLAVVDTNLQAANTGNKLTGGYGPMAVKLGSLQAGTISLDFSTLGRGKAEGFPDALVRINPTPGSILAVKPIEVTASNYQGKGALLDFIRGLYDTLAAEFGANIVVCDPDPGWTP